MPIQTLLPSNKATAKAQVEQEVDAIPEVGVQALLLVAENRSRLSAL